MAGERSAPNSGATVVARARRQTLRIHDRGQSSCSAAPAALRRRLSGGIGYCCRPATSPAASTSNGRHREAHRRKETALVRAMIQKHFDYTKSERAKLILANWDPSSRSCQGDAE